MSSSSSLICSTCVAATRTHVKRMADDVAALQDRCHSLESQNCKRRRLHQMCFLINADLTSDNDALTAKVDALTAALAAATSANDALTAKVATLTKQVGGVSAALDMSVATIGMLKGQLGLRRDPLCLGP